jgi:rubredoxin
MSVAIVCPECHREGKKSTVKKLENSDAIEVYECSNGHWWIYEEEKNDA